MLHWGLQWDRALFADPDRRGSIHQGLKSEICQCGFLTIGSLSPGHIVRATHFLSIGSKHFTLLYCYANNSKYERCDSAHAAIAAVAVAIAAAAAQRKRTAAAAAAQRQHSVSGGSGSRSLIAGSGSTAALALRQHSGVGGGSGSAVAAQLSRCAELAAAVATQWWRQRWQRQHSRVGVGGGSAISSQLRICGR